MPRSRYARPVANRIFTNRERPIAVFDAARTDLAPDCQRILGFYGVGGTGKSALCRRLHATLAAQDPRRHVWGDLDLAVEPLREPARGLLEQRRSLRKSGRIAFTVFDCALLTYWARAYPTEDLNRAFNDLLTDQEGLLGSIADNAPGWLDQAEALPAGLGLGVKALNYARRKLKERGAKQACEALNGLEGLDTTEILARLPWFLGLDLCAHRADPRALPPVVFIDTYEALWSDRPDKTGAAALETDAWVRELVAAAPGVLFVFFGRERLGWDRRFPRDWGGLLADQHLLGGLAEPDAQRFLAAIPIPDPAVRRAIILGATVDDGAPAALTSGAHPFYLDLAVETWLDLTADGGIPAPDDFGATHPEVLARFLRHRSREEIETLKVLAGPRSFDRALFVALVEHFGTRYPLTAFGDLTGLSFIETGADGRYRLHGLMREHLQEELDAATALDLAALLFDWFDARCQPASPRELTTDHEIALREAVHHRGTEDALAALDWFWERAGSFRDSARYALLEPLCRWALDLAEDRLGPEDPCTAHALNNLANLLQNTNHLLEAEPLMRRALAIDEASYGPDHPAVARDLNNLAQQLQATDRLPEAEPLMRRALLILLAFSRTTGHAHPRLRLFLANYRSLLAAWSPDLAESARRLADLGTESGLPPDEWDRLLAG